MGRLPRRLGISLNCLGHSNSPCSSEWGVKGAATGAVLGGIGATACTSTTMGACVLGIPAFVGGGTAFGGAVGYGAGKIADWVYDKVKDVPDQGTPGEWVDGERRSRQYGPDGKPAVDLDKPHQGAPDPHAHEWQGGKREHPGRPVSILPPW